MPRDVISSYFLGKRVRRHDIIFFLKPGQTDPLVVRCILPAFGYYERMDVTINIINNVWLAKQLGTVTWVLH